MSLAFEFVVISIVPTEVPCVSCERGEWGQWLGDVTVVPGGWPCRACGGGWWGQWNAGRGNGMHAFEIMISTVHTMVPCVRCEMGYGEKRVIFVGNFLIQMIV